jgi:Na+:H+ antiporter, NhaA family
VEDPEAHDTLNEFERRWRVPVQIVLFFFGLVNAGIPLASTGAGTWVVLSAIIVGKPVGILAATAAAVAFGLHRPARVSWPDLVVVSMTAAIGFTVALFFATAAFPPGHLLDETKMGALLSISAGAVSFAAAFALGTGRFQRASRASRP